MINSVKYICILWIFNGPKYAVCTANGFQTIKKRSRVNKLQK
jgi:hypothetical protein